MSKPATILVVDDEAEVLKLLDIELSSQGYEVIKADTGHEAIVKAQESVPDLILMDVMLPDLDGGQAVKRLKESARTKDIPILFLTAILTKNEEDKTQLGLNVDGEWYHAIAKPFKHEELLEKVKEAVRKPSP